MQLFFLHLNTLFPIKMEKLTEIATNVSTPLALAGLIAALSFYLLKILLSKNIFPKLTRQFSSQLLLLIFNRFFTLSIVAMSFGLIGFLYTKSIEGNGMQRMRIEGIVFVDNAEMSNVTVKVLEIERVAVTNDFGKFIIGDIYDMRKKYTLKFSFKDTDTVIAINSSDDLRNLVFRLRSTMAPPGIVENNKETIGEEPKERFKQVKNASTGTSHRPEDKITVDETYPEVEIPRTFTPNDDGMNDVFSIKSPGVVDVSCKIFNRWGEELFNWQGLNGGWKGINKRGEQVKEDQYFYSCNILFRNGKKINKQGQVTLIR